MPAQVMQVVSAVKHPNADSLRLYEFESAAGVKHQIIANLENVYEVGDLVNVVTEGSVLKDGTKIKTTTLRGVPSHGMALGHAVAGAQLGDDVTDQFCLIVEPQEAGDLPPHVKWPSIEALSSVRTGCENSGFSPKLRYRAKVKLDGTNAGIQVFPDGRVFAQSRSNVTPRGDDGYGFAAWVDDNKDYFASLKKDNTRITIFGEWCGPGVQKRNIAISKIDRKVFVVFAVHIGNNDEHSLLECEPDVIKLLLGTGHKDVFVLPWYKEELVLDFRDSGQLQSQADIINKWVDELEVCDPWVKDTFNIDGIGEGVVLFPRPDTGTQPGMYLYSDFMFKAKGEKHRTARTKEAVQIDPELVKSVDAFVNMFVTEPRLEQGVKEACEGSCDIKKMGAFIKWFNGDVMKESTAELARSGLDWKQVGKAVSSAASSWYKKQCAKL